MDVGVIGRGAARTIVLLGMQAICYCILWCFRWFYCGRIFEVI